MKCQSLSALEMMLHLRFSASLLLLKFLRSSSFLSVSDSTFASRRIGSREADGPSRTAPTGGFCLLMAVIQADEVDFEFDIGQGGVSLAQKTAIQISGKVQHAPGTAKAQLDSLQRFNQLRTISDAALQKVFQSTSAKIVATGIGKELYKDPGASTVKEVIQTPKDAVRDALIGAGSAIGCEQVHLNFLGGDDLQVLEVLDAVEQAVLMLDVKTKCKIFFRSISDSQFPKQVATVTVVGMDDAVNEGSAVLADLVDPVERSVALGSVFFRDGIYYTAVDNDLNPSET